MRLFALAALSTLCLAAPAVAADLGPYPPERDTYVAPPPPTVDRKIVEHHYYYHEAPAVYPERRVYVEPRAYRPHIYTERVYPRYAYAYSGWRPHYFFPRRQFRGARHGHWY
jgi:hypothetical protein